MQRTHLRINAFGDEAVNNFGIYALGFGVGIGVGGKDLVKMILAGTEEDLTAGIDDDHL